MADKETARMAGDYEIMQSFRMGGTTMLIGYNPGDTTYMTCYQDYDFLGNERFSEAIGSESYVEIMNRYFIDHPDMVLGEMKMVSGAYGPEPTCVPFPEQPLDSLLVNAVQNIHGEINAYDRAEELEGEDQSIAADSTVRNFSYTLVDGKLYYRENSRMNPVEVSKTAESRIRGMIGLRDCVRTLLEYQTEDYPDGMIRQQQAKLNDLYDRFTHDYGLINSRGNAIAFDQDSAYFLLCSLEVLDEEGGLKRKADLFTKRTIRSHRPAERVDQGIVLLVPRRYGGRNQTRANAGAENRKG